MTTARLVAQRMANQGLTHRPAADPAQAARICAGIQAQDLWASRLAVRSRSATAGLADVIAATEAPPQVIRTWPMRGTLHLVAAEDARWLIETVGPTVLRASSKRRRDLGLDDALLNRLRAALPDVLTGRQLTRPELVETLGRRGIGLGPDNQAAAHVVYWAAATGLICRGPDRGAQSTFVLLEEWLPDRTGPTGEAALAELARRHVRAFGPVSSEDFAAWSRLPMPMCRAAFGAIGAEVETVTVDDRPLVMIEPVEPGRNVLRLLAGFDTYLMGYRSRDAMLHSSRHKRIVDGGILYPSMMLDGTLLGRWRLDRSREPARVSVEFFDPPPRGVRQQLDAEVADIARFLDREVRLVEGWSRAGRGLVEG